MESEHLCKSGKQMGVFYRDTLDERSEHGTVYLLVLQEESIFPLVEHPWQLHQKRHMIDTVMGIVVTRAEGRSKAFRRLGLGRWVDDRLLAHCKPQDVVLVYSDIYTLARVAAQSPFHSDAFPRLPYSSLDWLSINMWLRQAWYVSTSE